jgi:hypothetical protein
MSIEITCNPSSVRGMGLCDVRWKPNLIDRYFSHRSLFTKRTAHSLPALRGASCRSIPHSLAQWEHVRGVNRRIFTSPRLSDI